MLHATIVIIRVRFIDGILVILNSKIKVNFQQKILLIQQLQ